MRDLGELVADHRRHAGFWGWHCVVMLQLTFLSVLMICSGWLWWAGLCLLGGSIELLLLQFHVRRLRALDDELETYLSANPAATTTNRETHD